MNSYKVYLASKYGLYTRCMITLVVLLSSFTAFSQQAWFQVATPDISMTRNILHGISGTSSSDVWTVGSYETSTPGYLKNLLMHWNGSSWEIIPGTDLSVTFNELWDVTSIAGNDAWSVGTQNNFAVARPQLMHWNGTSWSHTLLPDIPGGSFLFAIDHVSSNDIWAVGGQSGSPTKPAYTVHYNGSSWTEIAAPSIGTYHNVFNAVDAFAPDDAWAVGYFGNHRGDYHAMAQHWNGSHWVNTTLPASVSSPLGELYSVTIIGPDDVWALGSTLEGALIAIHWNGSNWTEQPTSGLGGGAVVANSAGIFGVGARISKWNGNNWSVIDSLQQLSFPTLNTAIAFSNGDIWAAGRTFDTSFHSLVYKSTHVITHLSQDVKFKPITIFPNPATDRVVNIRFNSPESGMLYLFDQHGQQLMSKTINDTPSTLSLSLPNGIATGTYLIVVVNENTFWTEKIVIP